MKGSIKQRVDMAEYTLNLSYDLITHYDNKTNQQLTIAGFDFAIISMLLTAMFASSSCGRLTEIVIICMSFISYLILSVALWQIRGALMPHVIHHNAGVKKKSGLFYFKDIKKTFEEEEYVQTLMGTTGEKPVASDYYTDEDADSFAKCLIEDCARDIYAHAVILEEKTRHVHAVFNWVYVTTIACIITVAISSVMWVVGV